AGNLKTDENQKVEASGETIVIESSDPEVIYVPCYDTTVIYGGWPYPYYPPGYHYGVGVAVAVGFAWGYAWGHCDWNGGDVDIDIDRNVNRNRNIDRNKARMDAGNRGNKMTWKHDAKHRGGLPYKDSATAQRFGGTTAKDAASARDSFRGKTAGNGGAGVADRGLSGSRAPS